MKLKLTGWNAVLTLIVIVGLAIFRFETQTKTLESQGIQQVKNWLAAESTRVALPGMQKAMNDPQSNQDYLTNMSENLQSNNIKIVSITAHGSGSSIVARVEVRYKGKSPSDGMNVRYLRMKYSMVTGWKVVREASKWDYYMSAFGTPRPS